MTYRKQDQGDDLFSAIEHQKKIGNRIVGILKLRDLIKWEAFRPVLEEVLGYDQRDSRKGGRPPFDPIFMFKVLVLQKYHGLSDLATEVQIKDRISFMSFLGLRLGDDVPDANTIWDFKQLLEKDGRDGSRKLFNTFHSVLRGEGLIAREGSIVDASFVEAPRQRNSRKENQQIKEGKERPKGFERDSFRGRQKDCDARWTKKNNESHYGYKNHTKVDVKSKLIDIYTTTAASVHDSQVFKELVSDEDNAVLADSAYHSEEHEDYLIECNSEEFLMRKAYKNKPLSEEEKIFNKKVSRIRVRVEHVFGRMKHMGMDLIRSVGLERAKQHNSLCNLVYNLDRYAFLKS